MNLAQYDKTYLIILIIVVAGLSMSQYYYHTKLTELTEKNISSPVTQLTTQEVTVPTVSTVPTVTTVTSPTQDIITNYDYRVIADPLKEPGKRPPRHIIGPMIGNPHFNIPTRGYPDSFNLQGYLIDEASTDKNDENRMLRLYGRQKYPNSNEWEYYVEVNVGNDKFKFDLEKQKREVFDGDSIYVETIKRNYIVKLLKQKGLEYNPFLW